VGLSVFDSPLLITKEAVRMKSIFAIQISVLFLRIDAYNTGSAALEVMVWRINLQMWMS